MPNENLKKLHSAVSAQYELPSIEVFEADMQDEGKRKKFYEAVSAEYELPEYNTFIVDMGFGEKKNSVTTEPLSSGGIVGASDVQSTESETGLFAPLQVPKMFAEKTLKVKETPAPKGQYTLEREGQKANVNRDDIFKNLENEEFLKGVKSGEVKVDIQDDEALGNLLNEKLKFTETKPIEPKTATQEDIGFWESAGNSIKNIGTSLEGFTPRLNVLAADIWENVFGKELAAGYYKWEGRDIEQVRNNAYTKLAELEKQMLPTRGLVEAGKKKDLEGIAAGTVDAMTAIFSTAIPSLMTGGAGLVTEMVGSSVVDYNNAKAEEKGITVEELYQRGDAELATPTIVGSISAGMEGIGLKGIGKYINQNVKSVGTKKVADLLLTFNKEGLTELVQTGLEDANNVLAKGGDIEEASKAAADGMFSEKGLEAYLKGGVGASGTAIAGRFIKGKYNALTKKNQEQTNKLQQEAEVAKQIANNPTVSKEAKEAVSKEVQETETAINEIQKQEIEVYNSIDDKTEIDNLINEKNRLETIIGDEGITEEQKQVFVTKLEQVNSDIDKIFDSQVKELKTLVSGTTTTPTISEPIQPTEIKPQEQGVEETISESVEPMGSRGAEATTTVLEPLKDVESTAKALEEVAKINEDAVFDLEGDANIYINSIIGKKMYDIIDALPFSNEIKKQIRKHFSITESKDFRSTLGVNKIIKSNNIERTKSFIKNIGAEILRQKHGEGSKEYSIELDKLNNSVDVYVQSLLDAEEKAIEPKLDKNITNVVNALYDIQNKFSEIESEIPENTAEAYHKAKADGSNPELVKAVEELLTPKTEQDAKEQQSGQMREQSVQEATQRKSDSNMPIVNEAELQDREVVEEDVKPKKEKVFDYRQKKRQGDQLKKNKTKFANKMQVATPFDWLVRFFVSGGRMDAKEAKDISGYGSKDLFGFIKEGGTKVDDMITQISEELNIEFDEVNFRGITVGEVLQLARVKAAKKGEKGNSIYDYAKRLMPNQNEIAQDEQAELGEELTPEQIQKLNNEAEIQRQIEDELKNKKAAELVPVLSEVVNGLSDAEINDFYKFFNIFRDADGNINWISIQEGINDPESFDGESVYMALDRLPKETKDKIINLINQENVRTRIKEIRDNQAIDFVDPFAVEEKPIEKDRRAELESRLAEAKNEVAQAEKELAQSIKDFEQDSAYKKAKASLDKDIQERQKDLFQMGAQAPLIDDLADKQRAVDKIKAERESVINESRKKLEAAKEKEQTVQQLLDDNLKGQKSLLDRLEDLKIKGGDQTGALMLAPKIYNTFLDIVIAGVKAGKLLSEAIAKGIDYLKSENVADIQPYIDDLITKVPEIKTQAKDLINALNINVKDLHKKARKINHVSFNKAVKDFTSINPNKIPTSILPNYIKALDSLTSRAPRYQDMIDLYYQIQAANTPKDRYSNIKSFADAEAAWEKIWSNEIKSVEDYRNLFKDINSLKRNLGKLLENGDITEEQYNDIIAEIGTQQQQVEQKFESEIAQLKIDLINEIRNKPISNSSEFTAEENAVIDKFNELNNNDLRQLSPENLFVLNELMDNIKVGEIDLFRFNDILSKAYTIDAGKQVAEQASKSELLKGKKVINEQEIRDNISEQESAFWEGLLGLGRRTSGAFQKFIISPFQRAISSYEKEIKDGYDAFLKAKKKYNISDKQMDKIGMVATYLQEYMAQYNPKWKNTKEIGSRDWFKTILETPSMKAKYPAAAQTTWEKIRTAVGFKPKSQIELIEELWKSLPKDANGSVSPEAVYNSYMANDGKFLTKNEKAFFEEMTKWKEDNITDKQRAANEFKGNPFEETPFHMMRIRFSDTGQQVAPKATGESGNVRIEAGTGKERTSQRIEAIETNYEKAFIKGLEQTARDYHLTKMLQDVNNTLATAKKNADESTKPIINAMSNILSDALNFEFDKKGVGNSFRTLMQARAALTLLDPERTLRELLSSAISYPIRSKTPQGYKQLFGGQKTMRGLLEFTESPLRLRENINKAVDVEDGKITPASKFEKATIYLSGFPERAMMVTAWMPTFNNEFERLTGNKFSSESFNTNKTYREKYGKQIKEAAAAADAQTEKIIGSTTKAGQRKKVKIAPKVSVDKDSPIGQILGFFSNYPYREINEFVNGFKEAAEAIRSGDGGISAAKQLMKPLGITLNVAAYGYLSNLAFNIIAEAIGTDDEKEKAKEELESLTTLDGFLQDLGGNMASLAAAKYSGGGRALMQTAATIAYANAETKEEKAKIKKWLKDTIYLDPLPLEDVSGYGGKDKANAALARYVPQFAVISDRLIDTMGGIKEIERIYQKIEESGVESLTNDEQQRLLVLDVMIKSAQLIATANGTSLPMYNKLKMFMRGELEDAGYSEKKKQTKKQGSTLGTVIETSDRQTTERQTTERQATPREPE